MTTWISIFVGTYITLLFVMLLPEFRGAKVRRAGVIMKALAVLAARNWVRILLWLFMSMTMAADLVLVLTGQWTTAVLLTVAVFGITGPARKGSRGWH